ncbi:MAG TPA: hypothetical protein VFE62_09865, partial [Gemmataceae bacterium]|nr:hypothetical protein [Gemmataceae bacterium]
RHLAAELEVWDVGTGKKRGVIEGGPIQKGGLARITPDSQIYCVLTRDDPPIIAWNLDSCRRLWPAKQPMPDVGIVVSSITVRDDSWVFTPNSSFIVHRNRLSIDAIDLATGEVQSSLTLGSDATPDFQSPSSGYVRSFTPDGQWMVSVWDCPASGLQEWLSQWLPLRKSSRSVVVSELATGRIVLTLRPSHVLGNTMLSDDGRVLMTSTFRGDECTVRCWDVPGRPALRYVLGIPAGIGCGVLLILWWLRIRRAS